MSRLKCRVNVSEQDLVARSEHDFLASHKLPRDIQHSFRSTCAFFRFALLSSSSTCSHHHSHIPRWSAPNETMGPPRQIAPNITPFRFLDLPPEIRNLVYEFTSSNQHATLLANKSKASLYRRLRRKLRNKDPSIFSLLQVCRQIRSDAAHYVFVNATVVMGWHDSHMDVPEYLFRWVQNSRIKRFTAQFKTQLQSVQHVQADQLTPFVTLLRSSDMLRAGKSKSILHKSIPTLNAGTQALRQRFSNVTTLT